MTKTKTDRSSTPLDQQLDPEVIAFGQQFDQRSPLDQLVREGARKLLQQAIDAKVEASIKSGEALDGAAYGALKRAINSKGKSVVLHDLYFDGMTLKAPDPTADVRAAIGKRFGSIEKWVGDFIASAKSAAGSASYRVHCVSGQRKSKRDELGRMPGPPPRQIR